MCRFWVSVTFVSAAWIDHSLVSVLKCNCDQRLVCESWERGEKSSVCAVGVGGKLNRLYVKGSRHFACKHYKRFQTENAGFWYLAFYFLHVSVHDQNERANLTASVSIWYSPRYRHVDRWAKPLPSFEFCCQDMQASVAVQFLKYGAIHSKCWI